MSKMLSNCPIQWETLLNMSMGLNNGKMYEDVTINENFFFVSAHCECQWKSCILLSSMVFYGQEPQAMKSKACALLYCCVSV